MAEYIEREAAIEEAIDAVDEWSGGYNPHRAAMIRDGINTIHAADVVPVVRCKECQNSYEWANVDGDNYRYCGYLRGRWNHDYDRMVDDDDFCKWGRKMDGEA